MLKTDSLSTDHKKRIRREPLNDTNFLLSITICTFVGMYIIAILAFGGGFLNPQQFLDLFNNNAALIIVSCGLTIVMITGGIDISVGGITCLVSMSCVVFLNGSGGSVLGSLGLALAIGLAFGVFQGFLISYLEIQPFIITLAGMFMAKGMTTIVSSEPATAKNETFLSLKSTRIEIPWEWLGNYSRAGDFIPAKISLGVIVALVVVLSVFVILRWTRFGRNLYAIGGNSQSAITLGINVKHTKFCAYLLCGLLSGIAGYVYLMHTGAGNITNAHIYEMKAIASSIIGGTLLTGGVGNVFGTLFGSLTLMTINNIVVASGLTKPWWQSITTGAVLCFFILFQSVILAQRNKGGFKLGLPQWLKFTGKEKQ